MRPDDTPLAPETPSVPASEPVPVTVAVPDRQAEARDLCRSLILAERTISYRQLKQTIERLGLSLSRQLFSSVQRELAGTARGAELPDLEASPADESGQENPTLDGMRRATSAMDFMVDYLTAHPAATYEEVHGVARAEGHIVWPATYGRARQLARALARPRAPRVRRTEGGGASPSPVMAFLIEFVRSHPEAHYQEVSVAAKEAGHEIFPITFGNARRRAGLAKRTPRVPAGQRPRPAAPPPTTKSTPASSAITDFLDLVGRLEQQRAELQEALAQIRDIARNCLSRMR